MESSPSNARCELWKAKYPISADYFTPAESLFGHKLQLKIWKSLNRLRTQIRFPVPVSPSKVYLTYSRAHCSQPAVQDQLKATEATDKRAQVAAYWPYVV